MVEPATASARERRRTVVQPMKTLAERMSSAPEKQTFRRGVLYRDTPTHPASADFIVPGTATPTSCPSYVKARDHDPSRFMKRRWLQLSRAPKSGTTRKSAC